MDNVESVTCGFLTYFTARMVFFRTVYYPSSLYMYIRLRSSTNNSCLITYLNLLLMTEDRLYTF